MNEKIKEIQQWLWDHKFAPKNVSYEKFVDGYDGRMTQAALRKAKENHWEFKDTKPKFTMSWQKPSEKPKIVSEDILSQRLNQYTTIAKQKEKERLAKEQEDAKKYGSGMKGNARRFVKQLQEDLLREEYDLGKWGADGVMGNKTKQALAQAEKDGWQVVNNRLVKKPQQTEKPQQSKKSTTMGLPKITGVPGREGKAMALEQGFEYLWDRTKDAVNFIQRKIPGLSFFVNAPYEGSEEEARKLGYKHYTTDGFTRKPVDYSVPDQEGMPAQKRAQAQLDKYGITSEQTRDKSPFAKWVYEYSPGHGYNVFRLIENSVKGNKIRENGKRVLNTQPTPMADTFSDFAAEVFDYAGNPEMAQEMRAQKGYSIGESANRNDLSNLYFGYPMQGKSLRISERTETGKGNKPDQGYFYEFANDGHIYNDPAYRQATLGGGGVEATGENMGTWGASIDSEGNKAYYDLWDINPLTAIPGLKHLGNVDAIGTGFELYGKQKK